MLEEAGVGGVEVSVVVAPSLGSFVYQVPEGGGCSRRRASWRTAPGAGVDAFTYYQAHLILELARLLGGDAGPGGLEIHLDLTHGMNYATTAAYEAVAFAARVHAALHNSTVRVSVYTSEPYSPGVESLHVWEASSWLITPKAAALDLAYAYALARGAGGSIVSRAGDLLALGGDPRLKRMVGKEVKGVLGEGGLVGLQKLGEAAAASILYGLPLLLLQAGAEADALADGNPSRVVLQAVGRIVERFAFTVSLTAAGDAVEVVHDTAFKLDGVKRLLAVAALAAYAWHVYKDVSPATATFEAGGGGEGREVPVVLASKEELEAALAKMATPAVEMARRELSLLTRPYASEDLYEKYGRAVGECRQNPGAEPDIVEEELESVDRRILAAHAGLNKEAVRVACSGGRAVLYYLPNGLNAVKEAAAGLLEDFAASLRGGGLG